MFVENGAARGKEKRYEGGGGGEKKAAESALGAASRKGNGSGLPDRITFLEGEMGGKKRGGANFFIGLRIIRKKTGCADVW